MVFEQEGGAVMCRAFPKGFGDVMRTLGPELGCVGPEGGGYGALDQDLIPHQVVAGNCAGLEYGGGALAIEQVEQLHSILPALRFIFRRMRSDRRAFSRDC